MNAPDLTPAIYRRLWIAGALFGFTIGAVMSWTTILTPFLTLRDVPIDAGSFGVGADTVATVTAINVIGLTLGGYLVARLWDRALLPAVFLGALSAAVVRALTAFVQTMASLENNLNAEFIQVYLPVGLIFGAGVWFLYGLVISGIGYFALSRAADLFASRRAMLAWTLMIGAGVLVGYVAGGINQQRLDTVAAARAVRGAILIATGQEPPLSELPRGFEVSGPALDTLRSLGARIRQPYRITYSRDDSTANEVVTDTRFQDGLLVRCVSSGAYISRCYEYEAP